MAVQADEAPAAVPAVRRRRRGQIGLAGKIVLVGSVAVTFFTAFTLAWLIERTDLPWRTAMFTAILFPLLVPGIVMAFAWTLLFAPNAGWINVLLRGVFGLPSPGPIDIFSMPG